MHYFLISFLEMAQSHTNVWLLDYQVELDTRDYGFVP